MNNQVFDELMKLADQMRQASVTNWQQSEEWRDVLECNLRTALAAPKQAEPSWQPIETAPKDGTAFLGLRGNKIANCYRVQRDDCEMWNFGGSSGAVEIAPHTKPTHWMPLPTPPEAKA